MGVDAGFDIVPRLSTGALDRQNWRSFMKVIEERYQDDDLVEIKPNQIVFKIGEYPRLPYEGHKCLRFNSKISGRQGSGVFEYIKTVTLIAKAYFGSRIQYWHEGADNYGVCDWNEVNESLRTYEQVRDSLLRGQ